MLCVSPSPGHGDRRCWQNTSSPDVSAFGDIFSGQKSPNGPPRPTCCFSREQSVLAGHRKENATQQPCQGGRAPSRCRGTGASGSTSDTDILS